MANKLAKTNANVIEFVKEKNLEGLKFDVHCYQDAVQLLNDLGNLKIQGKISDSDMKSLGWLIQLLQGALNGLKEEVKLSKMEKQLKELIERKG